MKKDLFLFAGEGYMVRNSVNKLKRTLDINLPEININEFKSVPKGEELKEACVSVPLMAEKKLIIVSDCSSAFSAKGGAEDSRKISDAIDVMPEATMLALCSYESPDKRKALYKKIKELGQINEFKAPTRAECIEFVMRQVKNNQATVSRKNAEAIVDAVGYDYYSLENEVSKLAACSGYCEITDRDIAECVSRSLEYNVFEIHSKLAGGKAKEASRLLNDIMRDERPEAVIGLVARKIRDMYKVKALLLRGDSISMIASTIGVKEFAAEMLARECRRYSQEELRIALKKLADLDYEIKCGEKDAYLTLPVVLYEIYKMQEGV